MSPTSANPWEGPRIRAVVATLLPWILLIGASWLAFSRLRQPSAMLQLWRSWAEVGVLACGMTAIILTGGIDLSVGSIIALCGVVLGVLWHGLGWPIGPAAAGAMAVGLLAGAINGTLVLIGISPLVATLATMASYEGLAMAISRGARVAGLPASFTALGQGAWLGLPNQLWLLVIVFAVAAIVVHHTRFGRYLYAIGDNRTAAELAAVPVGWLEWSLYCTSGVLAGTVALIYTARAGAAVPNAGLGLELQVIACVVLGGTRVTGGAGGIGRTLLGLAILAHLEIGLRLLRSVHIPVPGTSLSWQLNANGRLVVIGLLLIAVAVLNERLASGKDASSRA
ncbi:MAG TPA: ABC transporter permease [Isosphaeraceae bacterium]|jgi:ribose/xylose/arabinose/galactoside ABC-type transport system permease subunit|nr:ABC transporter permease [Isosphaeraceae bacterium]